MKINLLDYIEELENEDITIQQNEEYQRNLFLLYANKLEKSFSDIRLSLLKEYQKGAKLTGEKGLRKKLAAFDLEYFGRAYLPHYFVRNSPRFHEELDDIWGNGVLKGMNPYTHAKEISRRDGCRRAIEAPRGHAKSTTFTFKDTMHAALFEYKHYVIILSDSSDQAEGFLTDIKTEFEENPEIREDFGNQWGQKIWKTSEILLSNGVKIEAIGSGKKIRGRRHKQYRPDLIVLDDIENDENVNTLEQRRKLENWFYKAVSKAGDTYTDIVYIGTLLHYDSLLAKVTANPEYIAAKYQGVISFSENQADWDAWERIYTDLSNPNRQQDAKEFFEENKEAMLKGTEVLWEEKLSYYSLMVIRVSEGEASFNSEIQNNPVDPNSCTFQEEWFDFYEEDSVDFSSPEFLIFGANDPSLGKNIKSDTSSIIFVALNTRTGYIYVTVASVERRKPDVIIQDILELNRKIKIDYNKNLMKFGVETVQFQYFFKEILEKVSLETGEYLPIEEIDSIGNKKMRIESMQPFVKNGYIKFNAKHKTLLQQMKEFPMGRNDDGPDGLQMAVRLAMKYKGVAGKIEYKSILGRLLKFRKGGY